MRKLMISTPTAVHCAVLSTLLIASSGAYANEVVSGSPSQQPGSQISPADAAGAQAPEGRILTSPTQLTEKVRSVLGLPNSDVALAFGHGAAPHPFTTKRASADKGPTPVDEFPWRPTGKLFMKFGNATFVCTASVIEKGLLVTAAHCVHNFGEGADGFADSITFEPARHESSTPFGTWTGKQWWIPQVYFDGTDVCSTEAPGVVCENDVAVIVVEQKDGEFIGDVAGTYGFKDGDYGYPIFLGQKAAQFTQLGYPSRNFDGDKMIRSDSLGYQDDPNNVVIGSNQTGGSSGGPWLQNFGTETTDFTGTPPKDEESNQVTATTSWGFTTDTIKIQGASRFAKNTTFTVKSNIQTLVEAACAANPGFC